MWVFGHFVSGGRQPQFQSRGGTLQEDLALQNIQVPARGAKAPPFLSTCLVLSSLLPSFLAPLPVLM